MNTGNKELQAMSALAYVRKSTKNRGVSISKQRRVIRKYAKRLGLKIETEYSDRARQPIEQ